MSLCVTFAMILLAIYTAASSAGHEPRCLYYTCFFQGHAEQPHIWGLGKRVFSNKKSRYHNSLARRNWMAQVCWCKW